MGVCETNAQIMDLSKLIKSKKDKTEAFSRQLQNTKDSLLKVIDNKLYKSTSLDNIGMAIDNPYTYNFPIFYSGESMESLKRKSKELEKIKKRIEQDIIKKELELQRTDSIQKVNEIIKIEQERIADSLYLIRAAQTWEWLYDKKGKWEKVDRTYPKEEHYQVNSLFPQYQVINKNAYLNGKLVGVCHPTKNDKDQSEQDHLFRIDMINFLCQQDFLNNKYDIQKESSKTQEYIKAKLGLKKQSTPADSPVYKEMIANAQKFRIAQERLRKGEIDLNTYNRIKIKLGAKSTESVYQAMADSESPEINAGERYLEQLRDDNYPLIRSYTINRIDGTNFTYQFSNEKKEETLSVKVSFFVNENKEVRYKISSLQKK